jgi:hypothetical protein
MAVGSRQQRMRSLAPLSGHGRQALQRRAATSPPPSHSSVLLPPWLQPASSAKRGRNCPAHLAQVVQLDLEFVPYQLLHVSHARLLPVHHPMRRVGVALQLAAHLLKGGDGQGSTAGRGACAGAASLAACSHFVAAAKGWLNHMLNWRSWAPRPVPTTCGRMGSPLLSVICTQPEEAPRRTNDDTSSARPSSVVLPARPTQMAQTSEDFPVPAAWQEERWALGAESVPGAARQRVAFAGSGVNGGEAHHWGPAPGSTLGLARSQHLCRSAGGGGSLTGEKQREAWTLRARVPQSRAAAERTMKLWTSTRITEPRG